MLSMLYLLLSFFAGPQSDWVWRVFPESNFKVLAPVDLTLKVTEVPTEYEVVKYHQYQGGSVKGPPGAMSFVIDHYQLPAPMDAPDDTWYRDFFENTIEEMLTALDGTLIYIDIGNQPGREVCNWKASYQGGESIIRGQIIIAGDQYYGLQVFAKQRHKPEAAMQKFIESFKLLELAKPKL